MSMNHETDPTATSISTTDPANNNDNNVDTEADQPPSLNIVNTTSPHSISLQQQQQQHCSLKDPLYSSSGSYAVTSTPLPRQSRLFLQAPGQYSQLSSLNHHSSNSDNSRSNNNPELLPGPIAPSSPPHLNLLDNSGQQHHHQHHVVFSNISPNHSQESFNDAERLSENEGLLPRRRRSSFKIDDNPSATLKLRSRSVASRSSTSSMRDRVVHFPESPNISLVGSRRSSMIQNRSSIAGPSGGSSGAGSGGEHSSGGWISGISEVMASVSSRVVNTRAQEQLVRSISFSHPEQIESDLADHSRSNQRGSFHSEAVQPSTDVPPWVAVASSIHGVGSDHGSIRNLRRSASKRSSSSHGAAGTANLGAHSSQQDQLGPLHTTGNSRSGSGSHLGKSTQDEESVFTPGGFSHRGSDKMRLEGRSFMLFSPENPVRLWLASILMSKYTDPFILVVILAQWIFFVVTPTTFEAKNVFGTYWTHYGLLAVNILYTLEIMAKAIVYGFIFDRNGFQWKRWVPKRIHHFFISEKRASMKPKPVVLEKHEHAHSLARTNSVLSQASTLEKSKAQTNQATAALTAEEKIESSGSNFETDAQPAHAPFFRSYYNRLDGVVVISYWIDFAFMMTGVQKVYIFKAISALRPLRLLSLTEGTSTIIDSLSMSAPLLLTILGFIFFFFLILSLIGLLVFQGATSRRCAVQDEDDPTSWSPVLPEVICGGYWSNGTILGIVNYVGQGDGDDSSPRSSGMICPEGQVCVQFDNYNPSRGLVSFDNFFFSLLTVFTISSMEGWTDVQYWVMDGDSRWAAIFFCAVIFLMSFLLIPLFIAGITYSFGAVRAEKRHSAFSNKIRSTRTLLDTEEGWQFEDQIHEVRSPFRQWLIRVVNDPWFPIAGTVLVFFDLVVMCFRRYDSSPAALDWINNAETAFTFLFLLEICVRVAGHSTWHQFWKRKSNKFDLFLAITTMIILLPSVQNWEWHRYLTVFQVLRAYRLIPAIPGVRDLMNSVIGSATGMLNLLLITFMFLLVCAPIPMMLFGGEMVSDEEQPVNFDDLGQSFISLFIILTGENWVEIMYEGLDAHQETYKQIYGVIFFVVYYCASHYVLLNLFIAIVLEHFDLDEDEKYKKQLEIYFETHQKAKIDRTRSVFQYLNPYAYLPARPQTLSVNGLSVDQTVSIRKNVFRQFLEGDTAPVTTEIIESKPRLILWLEGIRDYWFPTQAQLEEVNGRKLLSKGQKAQLNQLNGGISGFGKVQDEIDANLERLDADLEKITWDRDRFFEDPQALETLTPEGYRKAKDREKAYADVHYAELQEFLEAHPLYDRSLFIFPSNNRFRQWCHRVVGPRSDRKLARMNRFNWFIFICILSSIAIIIADDPIDRLLAMTTGDTKKQDILGDIDYVITIIFVVEQSLRILADGFFFTPTAYLRDLWNCTDLFIVLMSCFMTFTHIDHLYNVSRTVRAASCLRVLRIVRYFEGVSAMFKAIAKALPKMVVALLMTALLFWPFAIYGVNIYAGYFYLCNDHGVLTKSECVGEFMSVVNEDTDDEILLPRIWSNPYDYSFDSIQAAVLTLFEMASQEGWVQVLQSGRAAPNRIGQQPFIQPDEPNRFNSFYFLLFMLIGSIVFVQIFIGVILETFKAWNGISLLTVEQRRWLDLRRQLRMIRPTATPIRPQNPIRAFCYDLVNEKKGFLWKIMTTVLALNVCLIASQHYAQPQTLTDIQDVSYFAFLGLYSVEIVIKLLGYGFHKWRLSRWNLYDLAITALALITLAPRFIGHELWTLRLENFLLITISFRLAQRVDSLQVLFRALVIALGSILNITAVFMVVFTVYAIMFRELFGMTRLGPSTTGIANFDSFGNTMLMLIRMTTGENWDFVMHDMMVEPPYCTPIRTSYLDSDCGSRPWAFFMFLSFYVVCTYILLNMFIAVIISNFSFAYQQDSVTTLITREDLRNFKMTWARFDPRGTGYIDVNDLSKFLRSLEGRFCTRVYAKPEYSIPSLVKLYVSIPTASVPRPSTTIEGNANPIVSSSPSINNGSASHRSVRGLGAVRRMSRLSVSPNMTSNSPGQQAASPLPKAVPNTTTGPEESDELGVKPTKMDAKLDISGLQQILSKIDTIDVFRRRKNFNLIYKEALATCTDRGISFYSILDILSFTLVDTEHALGMNEFLKRNERVKVVKSAVARETIHNLLLTIVARRSFLKQRRAKQNARLRPEVPRIVIDTSIGNERSFRQDQGPDTSPLLTSTSPSGRSSFLSSPVVDFSKGHHHTDDDVSPIMMSGYSINTMLSTNSNDSNGWDLYERDSFSRLSGQSDGFDFMAEPRVGLSSSPFTVDGSTWFNMLQEQIQEQDEALANNNLSSP